MKVFDHLIENVDINKQNAHLMTMTYKILNQKKLKRIINAWRKRISKEISKKTNLYVLNKCFSILGRHAADSLSKQARICQHLRNHLLLKNYFMRIGAWKRYSKNSRKAQRHRLKAIFRTWKKI